MLIIRILVSILPEELGNCFILLGNEAMAIKDGSLETTTDAYVSRLADLQMVQGSDTDVFRQVFRHIVCNELSRANLADDVDGAVVSQHPL